jgi:hypothetical protein
MRGAARDQKIKNRCRVLRRNRQAPRHRQIARKSAAVGFLFLGRRQPLLVANEGDRRARFNRQRRGSCIIVEVIREPRDGSWAVGKGGSRRPFSSFRHSPYMFIL